MLTLYEYCLKNNKPTLLQEWAVELNGTVTPQTLLPASNKKVWWQCKKGHTWQTSVNKRITGGTSCPYCTNRRVLPGFNDLAATDPEVAAQWHPTLNGALTPRDVTAGSSKMVWWQCSEGHEWQAKIYSRRNRRCPICSNTSVQPGFNDLATTDPEIAAQWHPSKNGGLLPTQVSCGSKMKVWWLCSEGHEWRAAVYSRSKSGCPVCAGQSIVPGYNDLATLYPNIASQWHPRKNNSAAPQTVSPFSNKKYWWVCEHGHEWQAVLSQRVFHNSQCPFCTNRQVLPGFNDLYTTYPKIAAQWHPTLNGNLTPAQVTAGCTRKVWWECPEGHVWKAVIYSRTGARRCGCPVCAGTVKSRKNAVSPLLSRDKSVASGD